MNALPEEPLSPPEVKALLHTIFERGRLTYSGHALDEMRRDRISEAEAITALKGGAVEPAEHESGSWRYRIRAGRTYVVISFRSQVSAIVVTAWRMKR